MSKALMYALLATTVSAGFAMGVLAFLTTDSIWFNIGLGSFTTVVLIFKVFR